MNFASWQHIAKSPMAYAYDEQTLHVRFQAEKNTLTSVKVMAGDPFYYDRTDEGYQWIPSAYDQPMTLEHTTSTHDVFHAFLKASTKRLKYAFIINDRYLFGAREIVDLGEQPELKTNLFNYFNFPYFLDKDCYQAPSWARNQLWYSIFPARFAKSETHSHNRPLRAWDDVENISNKDDFGGDLLGMKEKLPYIQEMGFTGLYLTPIFSAISHHQYDTLDYYLVDPKFGRNKDLIAFIEDAHRRGLKVMLDAVFNHLGVYHPFFLDVLEKGKDSPYYDGFYIIDESKPLLPFSVDALKRLSYAELKEALTPGRLNYRTFGFTPFMPKINLENPFMRQYFLDVAQHYVKTYQIDGWRLDVSNEVSHDFWRAFRQTVKEANPEAYIVGENWDESNPWLQGDQYDAVMNYGALFPLWQTFANVEGMPKYSKTQFIESIGKHLTTYTHPVLKHQYNLLDSHDTSRFLTLCEGNKDKFKQGYLMLYLIPGSPSVFYGDEIGMIGGHDPDNRRPMIWHPEQQNQDLQTFFKWLNHTRLKDARFRQVEMTFPKTKDETLLIVQKGTLTALFNLSDEPIKLPNFDDPMLDIFQQKPLTSNTLKPRGFLLLEPSSL